MPSPEAFGANLAIPIKQLASESVLQFGVAVAGRFASGALAILELRVPLGEPLDQPLLPLGFRSQFQEFLPQRHIDRQFGSDVIGKRNASFRLKRQRVTFEQDVVALVEELLELRGNSGIDTGEIFFQIFDVGLEIRLLHMRAKQAEGALPGGKNVGAAIFIFLQDLHDHRGTSDPRKVAFVGKDEPKRGFRFDAVAGHDPVTSLKDVQRYRLSWEENHVQREKRYAIGAHDFLAAIISEFSRRGIRLGLGQKERIVEPSGGYASRERANPIHAVVRPMIGSERGTQGARWIEGRTGKWSSQQNAHGD